MPRVLDMFPMDLYQWSYFKAQIQVIEPKSLFDLKQRIILPFITVRNAISQLVQDSVVPILSLIHLCIFTNGNPFSTIANTFQRLMYLLKAIFGYDNKFILISLFIFNISFFALCTTPKSYLTFLHEIILFDNTAI